jgi:hypothetical protein
MKAFLRVTVAATVLAVVAGPALAHSKSYCAQVAKHDANAQAAGKTIVGAGLGCLFGQIFFKKCGAGAAVGGVGGFAIGSAKWHEVYDESYSECRNS